VLPQLTRGWQDRQKELELKRDVVTQIAEASAVAVRREIANAPGRDVALREWLVQRSISNAIIATYFPDLADCWFVYSDAITSFLQLRGKHPESKAEEINRALETTRRSCAWDQGLPPAETARLRTLEKQLPLTNVTPKRVPKILSGLGELLLIGKDGIIRRIVAANARGYAQSPF
jgi:hypothetical protein